MVTGTTPAATSQRRATPPPSGLAAVAVPSYSGNLSTPPETVSLSPWTPPELCSGRSVSGGRVACRKGTQSESTVIARCERRMQRKLVSVDHYSQLVLLVLLAINATY